MFNLDWEYFKNDVLPLLSDKDTVVFLGVSPKEPQVEEVLRLVQGKACTVGLVTTSQNVSQLC